jgi:hypothetical protein
MLTFPAQREHHRSLVLEPVGSGFWIERARYAVF